MSGWLDRLGKRSAPTARQRCRGCRTCSRQERHGRTYPYADLQPVLRAEGADQAGRASHRLHPEDGAHRAPRRRRVRAAPSAASGVLRDRLPQVLRLRSAVRGAAGRWRPQEDMQHPVCRRAQAPHRKRPQAQPRAHRARGRLGHHPGTGTGDAAQGAQVPDARLRGQAHGQARPVQQQAPRPHHPDRRRGNAHPWQHEDNLPILQRPAPEGRQ